MVDLKSLDTLDWHLGNLWKMNEGKKAVASGGSVKEEWDIDPRSLVVHGYISKGTYGWVHRGVYEGQDVAVKVLDWGEDDDTNSKQTASLRRAFRKEVSVWYKLNHPNVSKLIGGISGTSDIEFQSQTSDMPRKVCCIVTEYQPGGTLRSYLEKNKQRKLDFKTVIELATDLARGLSYLHSRKVVHRDVKPDNMLLDKDGRIKITDFGTARLEALNEYEMTGFTGTFTYMAPEVLNSKPYTKKCDVYSFGICLWEMYCCDAPYNKKLSFSQLTIAIVYRNLRPEIPKSCPSSLAKVMKQCWDADPYQRPDMEDVVSMLQAIDTPKGRGMKPLHQPRSCFCWTR